MESLKEKLMSDIQSIFDTDGLSVEYESGDTESVVGLDSALCCIEDSKDIDRLVEELQAKTDLLALVVVEKCGIVEENTELREAFKEVKSIALQQLEFRLEDSECGMCEVGEAKDSLSYKIDKLLAKHK